MKVIYKYQFCVLDSFTLEMPGGAEILFAQEQSSAFFMWALVNPNMASVTRKFKIYGTGHVHEDNEFDNLEYLTSIQEKNDQFVWHIFEEIQE